MTPHSTLSEAAWSAQFFCGNQRVVGRPRSRIHLLQRLCRQMILSALVPSLVFSSMAAGQEVFDGEGVVAISTGEGRGADASAMSGNNLTLNFGDHRVLAVKSIDYAIKKVYLRFDLGSLPDGAKIGEAQLVLTSYNNHAKEQTIEVFGLLDGHHGEEWAEGAGGESHDLETGITYANAPGNAPSVGGGESREAEFSGGVLASETLRLGQFQTTREGALSGDVFTFSSPELTGFLQTQTNGLATLILTAQNRSNSEDVGFASKENLEQPGPELRLKLR